MKYLCKNTFDVLQLHTALCTFKPTDADKILQYTPCYICVLPMDCGTYAAMADNSITAFEVGQTELSHFPSQFF